jgi:hypothetical protein
MMKKLVSVGPLLQSLLSMSKSAGYGNPGTWQHVTAIIDSTKPELPQLQELLNILQNT